jgi:hypothetical protein
MRPERRSGSIKVWVSGANTSVRDRRRRDRRDGNSDEPHTQFRGPDDGSRLAVSSLRAPNLLIPAGAVSATGARWQRWKGTRQQPRAHRFPCNPQIGSRHLPDFAPHPTFRRTLDEALAETDYLPFHVNYAGRLFEESGGIEAARRAVGRVYPLPKPRPESRLQGLLQRLAPVSSFFTQGTGVPRTRLNNSYRMA